MTTADTTISTAEVEVRRSSRGHAWLAAVERVMGRLGDLLNPILVKEARQALKSKQFVVTFALLLTLVWVWSLMASIWIDPENFADAPRKSMDVFVGYFILLAFPLILVVPYGAFRSLAGEIEDSTYELLSVTTLSPRQIIGGKMGSAVLQMMLYLSAVSPCLAFTYLLPGVDIVTIGLILLYVTLASVLLTMGSLLLATVASQRHWQILLQVILMLGLAFVLWMISASGLFLIRERELGIVARDFEFWFAISVILAFYASFFAILFMCAKAMITFNSENRSTGIRIALLTPPLITFGALTFGNLQFGYEPESILAATVMMILFWGTAGSMITAESPFLSARMLRQLPQSLLGRACSAWFNPGPASGYMYVVLNFLALPLIATALGLLNFSDPNNPFYTSTELGIQIELAWVMWFYLVIFLGINRLLLTRLHHVAQVNVFLGFLTTSLLVLLGIAVPFLLQLVISQGRSMDYSLLHVTNIPYTAIEISRSTRDEDFMIIVKLILGVVATLVFLLNARGIWLSVLYDRGATPIRVVADNAEMTGGDKVHEPQKLNPWD